jgi:phage repressor protein C with HTH and peptisase S24 domain
VIALRVTGDSMEPEYKDGDIVHFANATARDGDDCLVRLGELENFEQTFKRVYFVAPRPENVDPQPVAVRLVPLNAKYPQREIRIEEVSGIFPALWKMTPTRHSAPR